MNRQPFLNMERFNIVLTQEHITKITGSFHVTTESAFARILYEGIRAGKDLAVRGQGTGRVDIHMLLTPPYPNDVLDNERLNKMFTEGHDTVIVVCIKKGALAIMDARLNHQAVVLQRKRIPPIRSTTLSRFPTKITTSTRLSASLWLTSTDRERLFSKAGCRRNLGWRHSTTT